MKKKTLLIAVAAIVLAVVSACSGTLAWLTADSDEVTYIFTVADINIELKEHEFVNGALTTTEVATNNTYKVVPGATEGKDPFVKVKKGSEPCYVYAKVVNNLVVNTAEKNQSANWVEVATCNITTDDTTNNVTGWTLIGTSTNSTTGATTYLYRYNAIVDALNATTNYVSTSAVFGSVTYAGETITSGNITQLAGQTIVIDAFAHQSANIGTDSTKADDAAIAWAKVTKVTNYAAIAN